MKEVNFIHTADWQIGKPYLKVKNEQKRFKLQQERINVINRIRDVIELEKSDFVLIAGDLFDSPTPSETSILEVLEVIGKMHIPVLVIPGNHDHGALGTIWHHNDFHRNQKKMAPNLKVLLNRKPKELDNAVILPCPLLRKKDNLDPTTWIRDLNWGELSSNKARVVLAHGAVHGFSPPNYVLDEEVQSAENNLLNLRELSNDQIDYIALGDWHNLKQINLKTWYAGTPEPDRFDQVKEQERGQILKVEVVRGKSPRVTPIKTGGIKWHNMNFQFNNDSDLERFEREVNDLISGRVSRDLLRVEVSGRLSMSGYSRYESLKEELGNRLLRLRIKGECQQIPKENELERLTKRSEDPIIAHVADELQNRLAIEEQKDEGDTSLTRLALCELFRLSEDN